MPHGFAPFSEKIALPRVWVLMGQKAGDNSQVLALAEALGWPFEIKNFVYQPYELVTNLLLGTTLSGVKKNESSTLEAPWPDLVLSAGRRNEPVARWIKAQAEPGKVRIVHVGRPWTMLEQFDLIVTTPQYRLPDLPNVLENDTPLHRIRTDRLIDDSAKWAPRLEHLSRPYVAVVIGGSSGPYGFSKKAAARLGAQANALAERMEGSLLITTSARTPQHTLGAMLANITVPFYLYEWTRNAAENPYFAFLGLSEAIIVTGDSMSMLTEACATGKPVHIFDLGEGKGAMNPDAQPVAPEAHGGWPEGAEVRAAFYRVMMKLGPTRLSRDIRIVHRHLIASGRATWLEDALAGKPAKVNGVPLDCLERAVGRVRGLFAEERRLSIAAEEALYDLSFPTAGVSAAS